ncbi:hypothetical protein B0W47_16760 (plasmid) [Komagataeibacter nataicola]|uniref:Pilus assembly protein n=1 Tax=Komagataeibacter nataicola TaxID=265960 RepID=A0A9N7CCH6_9PROT|nr:Flp family type IVb pilin [Komagataeibacter nataicola]AQU89231.1 hypothetical protein B0W47_16760 [Komagataeibacter nataicola]WNM10275.1 Flp family type IVb pilin [Komagataeibacter nataicola]GBR23507.1 hypothetical protein AA0616_2539 [Komagataeibacter nataicola NRIC 0616]
MKKTMNEDGNTAIEYVVIAALIAISCVTAWTLTGGNLNNVYCTIADEISGSLGSANCTGAHGNVMNSSNSKPITGNSFEQLDQDIAYYIGDEYHYSGIETGTGGMPAMWDGSTGTYKIDNYYVLSGIYKKDGTPVTSPKELDALYQQYKSAQDGADSPIVMTTDSSGEPTYTVTDVNTNTSGWGPGISTDTMKQENTNTYTGSSQYGYYNESPNKITEDNTTWTDTEPGFTCPSGYTDGTGTYHSETC